MRPLEIFSPERLAQLLIAAARRRRSPRSASPGGSRKTIGVCAQAGSARSRSHHDQPSSAGSDTVVTTTSGRIRDASANALGASPARLTWWPCCPSTLAVVR